MIRRIYVEKKADFAILAKELKNEMTQYLGIDSERVRALIRYDIENLSDETYEKAKVTVFSEPPVDDIYEEDFPHEESDFVFSVEYLPGQFDQRADSATQCVCLLNPAEEPIIRSTTTYVISGSLTEEQRAAVVKLSELKTRMLSMSIPTSEITRNVFQSSRTAARNFLRLSGLRSRSDRVSTATPNRRKLKSHELRALPDSPKSHRPAM